MEGASIPVQGEPSGIGQAGAENCPVALLSLHGLNSNLILESVLHSRIYTMLSNVQRSARSSTSSMFRWCKQSVLRVEHHISRWLKSSDVKHHLSRQSVRKALPLTAIIAGASACALWLNSIAAGVFALILLFLLSTIGRSLQLIAGFLRTHPEAVLQPAWRAPRIEGPNQHNVYISAKAMERLRPWVEDQSTLTEESAKAYCSVLLDTLAMLRPTMAGRARFEDS